MAAASPAFRSPSRPSSSAGAMPMDSRPARDAALLRGEVPCAVPALATAYAAGISATRARNGAAGETSWEPLGITELPRLLSRDASPQLRRLALATVAELAAAANAGDATALAAVHSALDDEETGKGLLVTVFETAGDLADLLEADVSPASETVAANMADAELAVKAIAALAQPTVITSYKQLPTKDSLRVLAAALAGLWRDAGREREAKRTGGLALKEVGMACQLSTVLLDNFFGHKDATEGLRDCLGFELKEPACQKAICYIISHNPNTSYSYDAAKLLAACSNNLKWRTSFCSSAVDGVHFLIESIASTMHDNNTLMRLLMACGNILGSTLKPDGNNGGESDYSALFVENDAFTLLQPACHNTDLMIALRATVSVSQLACNKVAAVHPGCSAALDDIVEVLQPLTPGLVRSSTRFLSSDLPPLIRMLSPDVSSTVHLAGLLRMASAIGQPEEKENARNTDLFGKSPPLVHSLRLVVASENPFVFAAAAYVLRAINLAVPPYNSAAKAKKKAIISGAADASAMALADWSIERVCEWVRTQPFKQYSPIFRDGFVTGGVLASITESDLAALEITHPLHRRLMLQSIEMLKATNGTAASAAIAAAAASRAAGGSGSDSAASRHTGYDVFISYRRVGGEDFAALLKVQLEQAGLTVFLDVENLGSGNFEDQLEKSLGNSKCVVLVWTKGCMDRFLDDIDDAKQDFVRKEYVFAIKRRKPIIPVMHEQFEIPSETRLPIDTRPVLSYQALKWVGQFRKESFQRLHDAIKANA
jgi:hypothetical protein